MSEIKDNYLNLLCDFGELNTLFVDAPNLDAFLKKIVDLVSRHMKSEVCSIYLFYQDTQRLVLRATKGLKESCVGQIEMDLGQGLTGLALKELRPLCVKDASEQKQYKYFPGVGEENFESFLAVPIVRGKTRIGVMVVQNNKKDQYDEQDIKILSAITSQLANTIETTKTLMDVHHAQKSPEAKDEKLETLKMVKGKVGSSGVAHGKVLIVRHESWDDLKTYGTQRKYSQEDFLSAVKDTEQQLEELQKELEEKFFDIASLVFTAQILMLKDQDFINAILARIQQGANASRALIDVAEEYFYRFDQMTDVYLQERKYDVKDVCKRLLLSMLGKDGPSFQMTGTIVIAEELFPSDILKLAVQNVAGLILLTGGVTSHLAILARSLQLPLVICQEAGLLALPPEATVWLDAELGNVYINPSAEILAPFQKRLSVKEEKKILEKIEGLCRSADGMGIDLMANINLLGDVSLAEQLGAQGIGLYRTEFPFIVRSDFPSEEEQYLIYRKLIEGMPGKEITFRTLDIGGDKVLSYYNFGKEENPFLGMRSIRFSLQHQDIFKQQIRAILRAGYQANIRIMFPMISSLDEFLLAKDIVRQCQEELSGEGMLYSQQIRVGMMVELPSVIEIIDDLAEEVDFFSIGTNDFIQYMLAVDRTNEKVEDLYIPHHPAILRSFYKIVQAANKQQKEVCICGDMAHDKKYIAFLLGLGIKKLSVDFGYLSRIRQAIEALSVKECRREVEEILRLNRVEEITKRIDSDC